MSVSVTVDESTVKARPGSRLSNSEARAVAPELFAIEQKFGSVTREAVVKRARDKRSALHKHFEWNIGKAAESYWLGQAGDLIRSVVYQVKIIGGPIDEPTRSFQPALVSVRRATEDEKLESIGYVSVGRALADPGMRAQILEQAAHELDAWTRRYKTLELLAATAATVSRVAKRIRKRAATMKKKGRRAASN